MTTKYSVKKCSSFGFAQSFKDALTLFKDISNNNVFYLHDTSTVENNDALIIDKLTKSINNRKQANQNNKFYNISTVDDITVPENKTGLLFVELGHMSTRTIKKPVSYDDTHIIEELNISNSTEEFKNAVMSIISDNTFFDEKKLSNEFISYLIEIYPHLRDYCLKKSILNILNFNNVNTIQLEKKYPFEYTDEEIDVVITSPAFSDIEISIDLNDNNISSSLYKPDKDFLKKAALGKTTQLDAFSENKFAIIHTKKSAGIENKIRNQNHDVLDTLAVNGVMKSPDTKKPLSIYRLMRKLEQFNKFSIVFIHPSYEIKCMLAEYPCEQIIPSYKINEGEILAIAYRYLVVYFFGYCSIFTDSMLEWRYYI